MAEPPFWITAETVLRKVEGRVGRALGKDGGRADPSEVADSCLRFAYAEIVSIMAGKSYTVADCDRWDFRRDYVLRLAMFFFYRDFGIDGYDSETMKELDVRPSLRATTFNILVGGVVLNPSSGDTGGDGTDTDTSGAPDLYGNGAFAVGRFTERPWNVRRDTRF